VAVCGPLPTDEGQLKKIQGLQQLERFQGLLSECQDQNLVLTVLYVPSLLDSGPASSLDSGPASSRGATRLRRVHNLVVAAPD